MKILVLGSGGREHALIKSFAKSTMVQKIYAVPGREGFEPEAECHNLSWQEKSLLLEFCKSRQVDLVFVGPEDPLVAGIASFLRENQIATVGPDQNAAQLEGSKIFAKKFMQEAGVPTAFAVPVTSVQEVKKEISKFTSPYVLKADGLCAGKGVFICDTQEELLEKSKEIFEEHRLGEAGKRALLEQFSAGWELSYLVLTDGKTHQTLPLAQDHKRLLDQNKGPNTGGMGTVAPLHIDSELRHQIETEIVIPSVQQIQKMNWTYRGVLFIGLMITKNGPSVLEYNVRFGDPETQVILPLIKNDWAEVCRQLAEGMLLPLEFSNECAACVVLASQGYPDQPQKGLALDFLQHQSGTKTNYLLHAGTKKSKGLWQTDGGRVLNAIGLGDNMSEALRKAYALSQNCSSKSLIYRKDIGQYLPAPANAH